MAEQKYTLILLLVGCLVAFASSQCTVAQIQACEASTGYVDDYGSPMLLNVPEDERDAFCEHIENFTICLNGFRDECSFARLENYSPYEKMGVFICSDHDADEPKYTTYYDVISNGTYRAAWQICFNGFDLEENDPSAEACGAMEDLVQCHLDAITEEPADAQTYVRDFGDAGLADYYDHFNCDSGSSNVGITSSLMIMSLLAYLWSTFH